MTLAQRTLFGTSRFEQWCAFHRENPQVYRLFRDIAVQRLSEGYRQYGARAIWEHMRWHLKRFKAHGTGPLGEPHEYRLNNIFAPYYARLLMLRGVVPGAADETGSGGFFETRDGQFDVSDDELLNEANVIDLNRWRPEDQEHQEKP